MRILHLVQCGPTTGGTVSHVATQATHPIRLGIEVGVVAASDSVLTEHCRRVGAQVLVDPSQAAIAPGEYRPNALLEVGAAFAPDLVHALGLTQHTHFYGSISGALSESLQADVLFAPSRADAASTVILEAMASKTPIVSTRVAGNPELIRDGLDAILLTHDAPQRIALAGSQILADKALATSLTTSAFTRYSDLFTAEQMAAKTVEVYTRILQ